MWSELALVDAGPMLIVLNPASGPGTAVDPNYTAVLESLEGTGVEVYGYVDTDYGRRPASAVLADADRYLEWYEPDGIFLDQTPSEPELLAYLAGIGDGLRQRGLRVAMNPGQPDFEPGLLDAADFIVNFEGPLQQYEQTSFPGWATENRSKMWHLVYDVPDASAMDAVLSRSAQTGANAIFVTDGVLPNPWDGLPPYWEVQISHVLGV
jgi:hypothetical protein